MFLHAIFTYARTLELRQQHSDRLISGTSEGSSTYNYRFDGYSISSLGTSDHALRWTGAAANGLTLAQGPRDTLAVPSGCILQLAGRRLVHPHFSLASSLTERSSPISTTGTVRHRQPIAGGPNRLGWSRTRPCHACRGGVPPIRGTTSPDGEFHHPRGVRGRLGCPSDGRLPVREHLVSPQSVTNDFACPPPGFRMYPISFQRWLAVVGLLVLVWIEVIFPVSTVLTVLAPAIPAIRRQRLLRQPCLN